MSLYEKLGNLDSTISSPLGIFIHGFGAKAQDIYDVANYFTEVVPDWYLPEGIVDMSQYLGYYGRAWFPDTYAELHTAMKKEYWKQLHLLDNPSIIRAAEYVYASITELGLIKRPLILAGFSQGAMLCNEIALLLMQHSIPVSAIILFSGALIAKDRWNKTMKMYSTLPLVQSIPIIQFHGNQDQVLPLTDGNALYDFWQQYTNNVQFHTFDGGHTIPFSITTKAKQFLIDTL